MFILSEFIFFNSTNFIISNEISIILSNEFANLCRHCPKTSKLDPLEPLGVLPKLLRKNRGKCQNKTINVMRNGQIQNKNDMLQVLCARLLIEMQFDISFQFY